MGSLKPLIFILAFCTFLSASAQVVHPASGLLLERPAQTSTLWSGTPVQQADEALQGYLDLHPEYRRSEVHFELLSEVKSLSAWHYTFQQYLQGVPVYQGIVKVNTTLNGQVYSLSDLALVQPIQSKSLMLLHSLPESQRKEQVWIPNTQGELELIHYLPANEERTEDVYLDQQGEKLFAIQRDRNHHGTDTTIWVKVFYPDPITSAHTKYGGVFSDFGDQSNRTLNDERFLKHIEATYDSGFFRLENDFVKMVDQGFPNITPIALAHDSFIFDRSNPHFEEVNVYFHINRFRGHLDSLGFSSLCNYAIHCDAHGKGDDDNSSYSNRFTPPHLFFGDGGVDDAEDATAIIHEYGHAVSDCASPNSYGGSARLAIDEGIGDYLAASYKREINEYEWEKVFRWDGHNEFWGGRWSGNNMIYPDHDRGTIHIRGQLVTGIFMDLWDDLGRDQTDRLFLESIHDLFIGMEYPDLADIIVAAEQRLFQGKYEAEVCIVLSKHGLRGGCFVSTPEWESAMDQGPELFNSNGFAHGDSPLSIRWNKEEEYLLYVYALNGELIAQFNGRGKEIQLSPEQLLPGTYLLQLKRGQQSGHYKVMRFR